MPDLISRQALDLWDRYKPTIAVDAIEYDRELRQLLGTNLAEVGTDLISRQAALDALNKLKESTYAVDYGIVDCDDAINAIAALPSTEPKKGKWIKTARWGRVYYCNQCRNYLDFDGVNAGRGSTNYCPNCGAKMRGEQDG